MIKYDELVKKLNSKVYAPLYLLMGDEPYYIDRIVEIFENQIVEESEKDFNQEVFYGRDSVAGDVVASAMQFPFGADKRVVILKEAQDIKNFELFADYAKHPSPNSILVIGYKKDKLAASKYKPFEQFGVVMESAKVRDYELSKWIINEVKKFDFTISDTMAGVLAEHIGNDLNRIYNELTKLKIFLPQGSAITAEVIEKNIGISKEYNVFELVDAINHRNIPKANSIAINMANSNNADVSPIPIIASLFNNFKTFMKFHLRPDNGQDTINEIFGKKHPFIIKQNMEAASRFTMPELQKIIAVLHTADAKSKGVDTNDDKGEIIKELVYRILH
ncbi:MAG: DNA polymerase III subunit delta [Bacteroidales bacterium]|jgi:DNA polymerase-3 subunit delta|nr:DNA polymerase III subunit delta [Bacteroidales bacterium]